MARTRNIYQTELLYVGPTGAFPATGRHSITGAGTDQGSVYGNILSATSGTNLVAELYRVQRIDHNWTNRLTDVNQFGELANIDRINLEPPTVSLTFSYLLANFINEHLMGLTVNNNTNTLVSCISGFLNSTTDVKNYFVKTVGEGNDAIDSNPATYDVISFGNGFLSSYTAQGSVGNFPTVDVTIEALNAQAQTVTHAAGAAIPAVNQTDGTNITGWGYILPSGLTSWNNLGLTNNQGISVLRPGDITMNLGLNAGDGFALESDIKAQSFNFSFNLNREDLQKLGTKYAYAKVPRFPVEASMSVNAFVGDFQTGSLVAIVNDNKDFNPYVKITKPGDSNTVIAYFQLRGAKLNSQDFSASIGANKSVTFNFSSQVAGPQSPNGAFLSGVVA